jgi:hypothetical protein
MNYTLRSILIFTFLLSKTCFSMEPPAVVSGIAGIIEEAVNERASFNHSQFMACPPKQWPEGFQTSLWPIIHEVVFEQTKAHFLSHQDGMVVSGPLMIIPNTKSLKTNVLTQFKENTSPLLNATIKNLTDTVEDIEIDGYLWNQFYTFLGGEIDVIIHKIYQLQRPSTATAAVAAFLDHDLTEVTFSKSLLESFSEVVTNELSLKTLRDNGVNISPLDQVSDEQESVASNNFQPDEAGDTAPSPDQSAGEWDEDWDGVFDEIDDDDIDYVQKQKSLLREWFTRHDQSVLDELKNYVFPHTEQEHFEVH